MQNAYRGASPPAGVSAPAYPFVAPSAGEILDLTILDEMIYGLVLHWVVHPETKKGRSRLCHEWQGGCPYHGHHRTYWCGWVAVADHGRKCRAVLRIGADSAKRLVLLSAPLGGLRGLRLLAERQHVGPTSGISFRRSPDAPLSPTPKTHDVEHAIRTVLGCETLPDWRLSAGDVSNMKEVV